jgi:type I restriction enzyme S subunit
MSCNSEFAISQRGTVMNFEGWKTSTLAPLCIKIGSGATPRGGKETYSEEGPYTLIRSQNVLDFFFSKEGLAHIDKDQATQLNNVEVKERDVLLNITGDSVARVCQVSKELLPARVNQHVSIIRPDISKIIPEFLKYYLLNPKFKNYMLGLASVGGTRNALTKSMIEDFSIQVPPLPIQHRIAEILSALDDKIELNRQTNATLEAIAQTIFKEWFVNFNFPGATGEMIESELGMIPKGWKVAKLGEILDVKGGTTPSTKVEEYWNGEYSFATPKDLSSLQSPFLLKTERRITAKGVNQISSGILPSGILLLSSRAPIGYLAISDIPVSINQGFIAINAKETSNLFILLWLKNNIETVIGRANGSTFLEISKSNFQEIKIIFPEKKIFVLFDELISPIFDQINSNEKQTILLTSIRDSLLPKLMNGEMGI